jgi:endoglucanase
MRLYGRMGFSHPDYKKGAHLSMKHTKLLASVLLAALTVFGACGCGGTDKTHTSANGITTLDDGSIREDLTAVELTELMGNGINLGNTMEAYGRASYGVGAEVSSYETSWGCPVTTQEMITGMKEAGFTAIRIPVAWTNAMNYENGDYTIGEDYLDRVEEIINYARNEDMYVIINDHWDGGWWGMFGSASEETRASAMEMYKSMWTQIAERYKEYSDYLIFESANEELGYRLNDTDVAEDSGTLSDAECYILTNEINQAFVDTVRGTGGNNAFRFLLIAGFGTDIENTCDSQFIMPADTASDKLLISVHYYDPSGYCINTSLSSWGDKNDYETMNASLEKMTQFTREGYGVIIGEYGVLIENNDIKDGTADYYTNFLNNCDLYGYAPMLWDCSNMYDRNQCKMIDDTIAALYQSRSLSAQADLSAEEIASAAQTGMEEALAAAPEGSGVDENTAIAWIMYNSSDWSTLYSVGDIYNPSDMTEGIVANDVEVTGEGTYTVSLDFTGTAVGYANSVVFSAVGISNGETLFPGYCINIKEILINGEPYTLKGRPYTTTDDNLCTRVNLYNSWVSAIPPEARTSDGNLNYVTPNLLDADTLGDVATIEVTFEYVPGKE